MNRNIRQLFNSSYEMFKCARAGLLGINTPQR